METIKYISGSCEVELGKTYRIIHKRKGDFLAKITAVKPTLDGDVDPYLIRAEIDTTHGNAQEWMANVVEFRDGKYSTPKMTEKLLRPSLISLIEEKK